MCSLAEPMALHAQCKQYWALYIAVQGMNQGPFFKFANGNPLTKAAFTQHIQAALQAYRLPGSQFTGDSFQIGVATTAATAGIEDSTIQMLGRWSSSAFLQYIHTGICIQWNGTVDWNGGME